MTEDSSNPRVIDLIFSSLNQDFVSNISDGDSYQLKYDIVMMCDNIGDTVEGMNPLVVISSLGIIAGNIAARICSRSPANETAEIAQDVAKHILKFMTASFPAFTQAIIEEEVK